MKGSSFFRYTVYLLMVIFVISRMLVSFREYQEDMEYSPISTYMTIAIIVVSLTFCLFNGSILLRDKLCRRVLLFLFLCLITTFLYGNYFMSTAKQIIFIAFWESVFMLFFCLVYYNDKSFAESKTVFLLLIIPVALLFLWSYILRSGMGYGITRSGNNMVFFLLTLFPWVLTSRKKTIRIVAILLSRILTSEGFI